MNHPSKIIKDAWNQWSETWYLRYRTDEAIAKLIDNPASAFHPTTFAMIRKAFPDLRGKRICVPSSGDNHAVFAFHLLGATVTSCDISDNQLDNSRRIAHKHGWDIAFVCEDTMALSSLTSGSFDFVYTSNGVHVWIHDLKAMYRSVHRVLKEGGAYIMYDIHPFLRPFGGTSEPTLHVVKPYDATGPFGEVPTYTWRIQDIVNAMVSSSLRFAHMEEMFAEDASFWVDESKDQEDTRSKEELEKLRDWRLNPTAALPQWLSIYAIK